MLYAQIFYNFGGEKSCLTFRVQGQQLNCSRENLRVYCLLLLFPFLSLIFSPVLLYVYVCRSNDPLTDWLSACMVAWVLSLSLLLPRAAWPTLIQWAEGRQKDRLVGKCYERTNILLTWGHFYAPEKTARDGTEKSISRDWLLYLQAGCRPEYRFRLSSRRCWKIFSLASDHT